MYTANTMASAIEGLGMALPFNASMPADGQDKRGEVTRVGAAIRNLLELNLKPRDIQTRESFENAMRLVIVLGGSTNAVLHLLALAKTAHVPLTIDDFRNVSDNTPYLADLKPSGKYVMEDLSGVGGVPGVMKLMLREGLLHGNVDDRYRQNHGREPGGGARLGRRPNHHPPCILPPSNPTGTSASCAATWPRTAP